MTSAEGPLPVRVVGGERRERRAARVGLDVAQGLVRVDAGEVQARPAAEERERALGRGHREVLLVLGPRRLRGLGHHRRELHEHRHRLRVAPGLRRRGADAGHRLRDHRRRRPRDEHRLGVPPGERQAPRGRPGLEDRRGALRPRARRGTGPARRTRCRGGRCRAPWPGRCRRRARRRARRRRPPRSPPRACSRPRGTPRPSRSAGRAASCSPRPRFAAALAR